MPETAGIRVRMEELTNLECVMSKWRELQVRAVHSYFLSAGWMSAWLESLPAAARPAVLIAESGERVVGLGFLGHHRQRRRVIFVDGRHLNETGDPRFDQIMIEHNGFLADTECEADVLRAFLDYLTGSCPEWDELSFSAVHQSNPLYEWLAHSTPEVSVRLVQEWAAPIVDLRRLREAKQDYLNAISSNSRSQIRRAMRLLEQWGPLEIDFPESVSSALSCFEELKRLHQATWQSRGKPGAFDSDFVDRFHRRLITQRWPTGEIQLLRIRAGSRTLGCLYNFLHAGRVLFYQSGCDYQMDAKFKPGLVCHALSIQHQLERGEDVYDFLAGDSQYKRSLSTDRELMRWYVWQRPRWSLRIENWLRNAKHRFVSASRLA